ncbi:NUDIX hydrolase [Candidatus Peregrinibacteria bacterium]|nr:MAG: NUDIX hydrolase [Candidatus Peregrinibacteria bacterium]
MKRIISTEEAMDYAGGTIRRTAVPADHDHFGRVTTPLINGSRMPLVRIETGDILLFRPQVTGLVVHNRDGVKTVLFTMSPKAFEDENWTLPGGGVDPGESLEDAFRRELADEELRVDRAYFENLRYVGDFKQPGNSKGDFYGKRHLHVCADYVGHPDDLNPDPTEIINTTWASPDDLGSILITFRNLERAEFTRKLIAHCLAD